MKTGTRKAMPSPLTGLASHRQYLRLARRRPRLTSAPPRATGPHASTPSQKPPRTRTSLAFAVAAVCLLVRCSSSSDSATSTQTDAGGPADDRATHDADSGTGDDETGTKDGAVCATACNAPPPATCTGPTTQRTYVRQGTCANAQCTYAHYDVVCQNGCAQGSCVGSDPCQGITCVAPPGATCQDPSTLKTYSASGTCNGGTCSYASSTTPCPNGCVNAACTGDPCAGLTCDQPPAATCTNGTTLRSYGAVGVCNAGSCGYTPTDAACTTAPANATATCSAGACTFTCNSGFARAGGSCLAGTPWTSQTSGTIAELKAVWGSGNGDVYAVGAAGTILHSTGNGTWAAQNSGTTQELSGIWGSGAGDVSGGAAAPISTPSARTA